MKKRINLIQKFGMSLFAVIGLSMSFLNSHAGTGFDLVTSEEYLEVVENGVNPDFDLVAKAVPGGPSISVVSPTVTKGALPSPVDIEVRFETVGDSTIDMSTLKIYYLMFIKKDVTDRILEHAEIGSDSIKASGAKLPDGKHKFLVEISDSKKRKSSQKFVVEVEA